MTVKVKICGITQLEDALACVEAGTDALGFNFWPGSKRYVEPRTAAWIAQQLPPMTLRVGVFVNQPRETIQQIAEQVGLHLIQLHGYETAADCVGLGRPVIKAIPFAGPQSAQATRAFQVAGFLVDAASPDFGGTGNTLDWSRLEGFPWERTLLAGGLTCDNVAKAVRAVGPYGVDVASGVESSPGRKDPTKVRRFVDAAKGSP